MTDIDFDELDRAVTSLMNKQGGAAASPTSLPSQQPTVDAAASASAGQDAGATETSLDRPTGSLSTQASSVAIISPVPIPPRPSQTTSSDDQTDQTVASSPVADQPSAAVDTEVDAKSQLSSAAADGASDQMVPETAPPATDHAPAIGEIGVELTPVASPEGASSSGEPGAPVAVPPVSEMAATPTGPLKIEIPALTVEPIQPVDTVKPSVDPEPLPTETAMPPVTPEAPPIEPKASSIEPKTPPVESEISSVEPDAPPVVAEELPVDVKKVPITLDEPSVASDKPSTTTDKSATKAEVSPGVTNEGDETSTSETKPDTIETSPFITKRSYNSGRFMDVVHPSSDMTHNRPAGPAPSRTGTFLQPIGTPTSDMVVIEAGGPDQAETSDTPSLHSPFVSGAVVEKRPLSVQQDDAPTKPRLELQPITPPEKDAEVVDEDDYDSMVEDSAWGVDAETKDQLPAGRSIAPEFGKDLMALESSEPTSMVPLIEEGLAAEPVATTASHGFPSDETAVPVPEAELSGAQADAPLGDTEPRDVTEDADEPYPSRRDEVGDDMVPAPVFEAASAVVEPHDAAPQQKKKSNWLTTLLIFLFLLIGAAGGAAVYFLLLQ